MTRHIDAIPEGSRSLTPYLTVKGAAGAIEFYKKAFGAQELVRLELPNGRIGHAELQIGNSRLMLCEELPEMGVLSPPSVGGSPMMIHLYVEAVDEVVKRAIAAGATLKKPVQDQFYGDRAGAITDPFGHQWYVATHVEDVPMDEIRRRAASVMKEHAA